MLRAKSEGLSMSFWETPLARSRAARAFLLRTRTDSCWAAATAAVAGPVDSGLSLRFFGGLEETGTLAGVARALDCSRGSCCSSTRFSRAVRSSRRRSFELLLGDTKAGRHNRSSSREGRMVLDDAGVGWGGRGLLLLFVAMEFSLMLLCRKKPCKRLSRRLTTLLLRVLIPLVAAMVIVCVLCDCGVVKPVKCVGRGLFLEPVVLGLVSRAGCVVGRDAEENLFCGFLWAGE
mmetsp:Transcript_16110/g.33335  ORF Transcript_16110/g.33335 Transcript_16110/m.33335 type:complete len:233 (-) Transcript_16110:28-726(-)